MSETVLSLRRKIKVTQDLSGIVRAMKAIAASNIAEYQRAVESLGRYMQAVELGLSVCLRHSELPAEGGEEAGSGRLVLVIGSEHGMVGQFNDSLLVFAKQVLDSSHERTIVRAVGERIQTRLEDVGLSSDAVYPTPNSVSNVTPLVAQILYDASETMEADGISTLWVFHNRLKLQTGYEPALQRLLPLDVSWVRRWRSIAWPTKLPPQIIAPGELALAALVRQFLFGSLFRAFTESLAAENASRFAAMQSAERNITEFESALTLQFHRRRQRAIDEELADVISGFEALSRE